MSAQKFTPWQAMRAYETQVRKIEDNWRIRLRNKVRINRILRTDLVN